MSAFSVFLWPFRICRLTAFSVASQCFASKRHKFSDFEIALLPSWLFPYAPQLLMAPPLRWGWGSSRLECVGARVWVPCVVAGEDHEFTLARAQFPWVHSCH